MTLPELIGRIRWATLKRGDRKSRERAYLRKAYCISVFAKEIWKAVYPSDSPLVWMNSFTKHDACLSFFAVHEGVKSDHYFLGLDQDNFWDLSRCESDENISFWTSEEFVAANIIAQIKSNDVANPPDELVETILNRYFEHEGIDADGQANAWLNRLNRLVCDLYQTAPVCVEALRLLEQGADFKESYEKAFATVERPELPTCIASVDSPGRYNMSYSYDGSCFYTIDHDGFAVCKEFPNESLPLNDYETLKTVAYAIVKDIRNGDESGLGDALYWLKEEPEWKGDCIMPQDRAPIS